jgi:hypothetical protein
MSDRDAIRTNGQTIGAPSRRIEELNPAISGHWTPSSEANARIVPLLLPIRRNVASGTTDIGTFRTCRVGPTMSVPGEDRKWSADGQNDAIDPKRKSASISISKRKPSSVGRTQQAPPNWGCFFCSFNSTPTEPIYNWAVNQRADWSKPSPFAQRSGL